MLTHIRVNAHVVWDDVMYHVSAAYQDDPQERPVVLEKRGVEPLGDDDSPEGVLAAVLGALQREGIPETLGRFGIVEADGWALSRPESDPPN